MNAVLAERFSREWIDAWNGHDLNAIMHHYAQDIHFTSPFIARLGASENGVIQGKKGLRDYFETALRKYPELNFEFIRCLEGLNSVVLYYISVNKLYAAEFMEFDDAGKVVRVTAHYTSA